MKTNPFQAKLNLLKAALQSQVKDQPPPEETPTISENVPVQELASQDQERLAALYRVSQSLGTSLDIDEVLAQAMDAVIDLTGAERGFLVLLDADAKNWKLRIARNFNQEERDLEVSRTLIDEVIKSAQGVVSTDAQTDPRFSDRQSVVFYALRSIMCAPLLARGQVIGAIYVDNRAQRGIFSQADLDMLKALAVQAAIAIANARLYTIKDRALVTLVENSPVAIVTLDMEGKVSLWNPAAERLFNYPQAEALEKYLNALIASPDRQDEAASTLNKALNGTSVHSITWHRRKDGSTVDVELLAVPMVVEGVQIGVLVIYTDVTLQKLIIELDQTKKEQQVAEITDTEYFRQLQAEAEKFRRSIKSSDE